jgi:hypothetical protein
MRQDIHAPPARFETAVPASELPQTQALRPRGYWDGHVVGFEGKIKASFQLGKTEKIT